MPLAEVAQNLSKVDYRKDGLRVSLIFLSCLIPHEIRRLVYWSCSGARNFFTVEKFET